MVGAGIPAFSANYHGAAMPFCLKAVRDGLFNSLFTPPV